MDPSSEIQYEYLPFIRVYKNGRIHRLTGTEQLPASLDPRTGVSSKDVVIQQETAISARLFLPRLAKNLQKKLPVLIYFHGGGFCIESASSPLYHHYCNLVASEANVVVVSVNYRRPPEHPLPAAYDDSWTAIQWVASHAKDGPEAWLANKGDISRVFLAGDSAGANIAHHMALRAGTAGREAGVRIKGVVLAHPFFWGTKPIRSEPSDSWSRRRFEGLWSFVCPSMPSADDPLINPLVDGAPSLSGLACERVLVCVGKMDVLRERGRAYYDKLKRSGWGGQAEFLESEGKGHVFHLFNPRSEEALEMMERLVNFMNRD